METPDFSTAPFIENHVSKKLKRELVRICSDLFVSNHSAVELLMEGSRLDYQKEDLCYINKVLTEFWNNWENKNSKKILRVFPESYHPRKRLLPGQHTGVKSLYINSNGESTSISISGGIRSIFSNLYRESSRNLEKLHAGITNGIVSNDIIIESSVSSALNNPYYSLTLKITPTGIILRDKISINEKRPDKRRHLFNPNKPLDFFDRRNILISEINGLVNNITSLVPSTN